MTDLAPMPPPALDPPASARLWRAGTIAAVVFLALAGWIFLAAAVVGGHDIAGLGPGMAALAPLLERLGVVLPEVAPHPAVGFAPADFAAVFAMWVAMVLAMMLPSAAPMLRAYAAAGAGALLVGAGYLAVWIGISVLATAIQAGLVTAGALSPHMAPAGVALSASVLIAAGIYQFTPLKLACLVRCRNPHAYVGAARGAGAALRLGVEEGFACLGCCWAMMAVMLAAGLMNLAAMAFLGALMALEKVVSGLSLTYGTGAILLLLGFGLASSLFFG